MSAASHGVVPDDRVRFTAHRRRVLGALARASANTAALGATLPLFLLVFASTYLGLASSQAQAFNEPLSHTDALYFTLTVFSTVGFGDITPRSEPARMIVTVQMVGDLIVLGSLARVVVGAVRMGRQRMADDGTIARQAL
jgi:voltage-gated potassium channel